MTSYCPYDYLSLLNYFHTSLVPYDSYSLIVPLNHPLVPSHLTLPLHPSSLTQSLPLTHSLHRILHSLSPLIPLLTFHLFSLFYPLFPKSVFPKSVSPYITISLYHYLNCNILYKILQYVTIIYFLSYFFIWFFSLCDSFPYTIITYLILTSC